MKKLLILDLDDTLFETGTIARNAVQSILDNFRRLVEGKFGSEQTDIIVQELWKFPFDHVAAKYGFDNNVVSEFAAAIENETLDFAINLYDDAHHLWDLDIEKILVTTGFPALQWAKIRSLQLQDRFSAIHIDDIMESPRRFKKGIFKEIVERRVSEPSGSGRVGDGRGVFVVGDNPASELKAGNELGFTTIQVAKLGQPKSGISDYYISDFIQLRSIVA